MQNKAKEPFGHEAMTGDAADRQSKIQNPKSKIVSKTVIVLDKKIIRQLALQQKDLVGIVKFQGRVIGDLADRIEELDRLDEESAARIKYLEGCLARVDRTARKLTVNQAPGTRN